jgi:hypothetical protein
MKRNVKTSLITKSKLVKVKNSIALHGSLFERVVAILEQARTEVVRSVNNQMVTAYWLVGREIVLEIQGGENEQSMAKGLSKIFR